MRLYAWIERVCLCVSKYAFTSLSALRRRKAEILCANVDIVKLSGESVLPRVLGPATAYVRTQGLQIDCCELKCASFSPPVVANV